MCPILPRRLVEVVEPLTSLFGLLGQNMFNGQDAMLVADAGLIGEQLVQTQQRVGARRSDEIDLALESINRFRALLLAQDESFRLQALSGVELFEQVGIPHGAWCGVHAAQEHARCQPFQLAQERIEELRVIGVVL